MSVPLCSPVETELISKTVRQFAIGPTDYSFLRLSNKENGSGCRFDDSFELGLGFLETLNFSLSQLPVSYCAYVPDARYSVRE